MTHNTQSNTSNTPEPKRHKKLNAEQIAVLQLLYKFRFASSKQIATYQQKRDHKHVQKRLKILENQGLIAKRYDKSYKLKGKPAAYHLLPDGARALETYVGREQDEPINFRRIYKDKEVSENFIEHCLHILTVYLRLTPLLSENEDLVYATKSDLSYEHFDYFPHPLPDVFISIETGDTEKEFFLDIFEITQPYFVLIRRIKKYLAYSGAGDWPEGDTGFPTVLIACANNSVQKRVRRRIAKELQESYEEVSFATTTINALMSDDKAWLPIDEDGDDPDEPQSPRSLDTL